MDRRETQVDGDYTGTISEIARAAAAGELDSERLGEILSQRHGAVNCYPGEPTDVQATRWPGLWPWKGDSAAVYNGILARPRAKLP